MLLTNQLGPYQILEEIGRGGMAAVYRARQASVDRDVAIKVILKGIAGDQAAVQRFQREAKLIARLEHPHILPVYDFDSTHEPPYLVMRYLDSGTLKEVMAQGLLPHDEIAYLMRQICAALDYAHRQNIVHRDIKPSNILIDREGNAFVSDLGIARIASGEAHKPITESGMIVGTPDYMSPEQAQGADDVDYRTDIYALGVMVFEMLTGELPYKAASGLQVLMLHMNEPIPYVTERKPDLPEAVDTVIHRAMAKAREERFHSAAEMSAALTAALGGTLTASPSRLREAAGTSVMRRLGKPPQTDSQATPSEQNKTVTALFANAAEYGELVADSSGAEAARRAINALWTAAEQVVIEQGGSVFAHSDNDLLALWGADAAREDDAEQAIRAALKLQDAMREFGAAFLDGDDALPLNIGIHRGLALLTPAEKTGSYTASGATISLANRLMQTAEGSILITHDVFRQVLGVFDMEAADALKVRGRIDKLATYRVKTAKPRAFRIALRGVEGVETRMVGREADFKQLQKAFLLAFEDGETQVVTLVSDAGIGKSRLLYEFDKWAELRPELYRLFSGRATPAMTRRAHALVRDLISFRFEILDDEPPAAALHKIESGIADLIGANEEMAHFLAYLCGIDLSDSPYLKGLQGDPGEANRRARQAFTRFLTILARREAVLIQLEDLHHADDASLDILNDLFIADESLHLLVVGCARPLLYERRPTWGSGQAFHTRLDLKPLDKRDSRDLAGEILKNAPEVPKELRDVLVERAEGNPLYMEELVKMLLDDHVILKDSEETWRIESSRLGALSVPSTLAGLLEARFDTLLYPEKLTLQRASVVGRIFYDSALQSIDSGDDTHIGDLAGVLAKLAERGFIHKRETSAFAGSVEYIFASAMLRDTLYDRLLERQRRVYHTGAAWWLASLERTDEYLSLIADHLEKAGENEQAVEFLLRAANASNERGNYHETVDVCERALALLESDAAARLPLLLAAGEALNRLGELPAARPLLDEAVALARQANDGDALANANYQLGLLEAERGEYPGALAYLDEALPLARAGTNRTTLARVLYGLANAHMRAANLSEARAAAEECIPLCERTGDDVLRMYVLNRMGTILNQFEENDAGSPMPYYEAARELAQRIGHRTGEQIVLNNLGYNALSHGAWDEGLHYIEAALLLARELDNLSGISSGANNLAHTYIRAGKPHAARPLLHEALVLARRQGSAAWESLYVSTVGQYKLALGNREGLGLLGLARAHPAATADATQDIEYWSDYCRDTLGMTDAEIESALVAGESLDLETVMDELLQELEG